MHSPQAKKRAQRNAKTAIKQEQSAETNVADYFLSCTRYTRHANVDLQLQIVRCSLRANWYRKDTEEICALPQWTARKGALRRSGAA